MNLKHPTRGEGGHISQGDRKLLLEALSRESWTRELCILMDDIPRSKLMGCVSTTQTNNSPASRLGSMIPGICFWTFTDLTSSSAVDRKTTLPHRTVVRMKLNNVCQAPAGWHPGLVCSQLGMAGATNTATVRIDGTAIEGGCFYCSSRLSHRV